MQRLFSVFLLALLAATSAGARTLDDVRSSGVVTCGLDPARPGLSVRSENHTWNGISIDLCRALAAAVFGDAARTNLVALAPEDHVIALQSGEIDVLMDGEPMQSGKDIADGLMWVVPFLHEAKPTLASFAPRVRQGDDQWFLAVREVEFELIRAAARGVTQMDAAALLKNNPEPAAQPADTAFSAGWRVRIVAAVGNHAEILRRNLGAGADAGVNAVWSGGGLHWAPP
jgi:hypothetical protein